MRFQAVLLAVACMCSMVMADRSNEWPTVFTVPEKPDTVVDTTKIRLSSDAKVFETTDKTNSRLEWAPSIASWKLRQRSLVMTSNEWRPYHARNQQYDFSGSLVRDSVLPKNGTLGLEWTPVANLNLRDTGGGFKSTNDFGVMMQWKAYEIPVGIRKRLEQQPSPSYHGQ
jgi:hypothetical protein